MTEWFKSILNQNKCWFIKFNFVDLYPSVSADVLNKSINFATFFVSIEGSIINTRKHARNSLPLDENGS